MKQGPSLKANATGGSPDQSHVLSPTLISCPRPWVHMCLECRAGKLSHL